MTHSVKQFVKQSPAILSDIHTSVDLRAAFTQKSQVISYKTKSITTVKKGRGYELSYITY